MSSNSTVPTSIINIWHSSVTLMTQRGFLIAITRKVQCHQQLLATVRVQSEFAECIFAYIILHPPVTICRCNLAVQHFPICHVPHPNSMIMAAVLPGHLPNIFSKTTVSGP